MIDINKFIIVSVSLLMLDFLWLSHFTPYFSEMILSVQSKPMIVKPVYAVIAYAVLCLFAYMFLPKVNNRFEAFMLGFLLYGVYDATNLATIDNWNPLYALTDSLWGGTLFLILYEILKDDAPRKIQ